MKQWLRRVRGAIGMGITWAVGWALGGLLIGAASVLLPFLPWWDTFFRVFDAPLPALAVPGFVGGAIFSVVLGVAARRRRFDELSLPRFAAWGALGGLLLSLVPAVMVATGMASTEGSSVGLWRATAVIITPFTLLATVSATVTLLIARRAARRDHADDDALANADTPEVLADGLSATDRPPAAGWRTTHDQRAGAFRQD